MKGRRAGICWNFCPFFLIMEGEIVGGQCRRGVGAGCSPQNLPSAVLLSGTWLPTDFYHYEKE